MVLIIVITLFVSVGPNTAVARDRVPLYEASRQAGASIRVVVLGDNAEETADLMRRWNTEFQRSFPDLSFYDDLIVESDATKWPDYLEQGTIFVTDDRTVDEMRRENIFENANDIAIDKFETHKDWILVERNVVDTIVLRDYKTLRCKLESLFLNYNELSVFFNINVSLSNKENGSGNSVCFYFLSQVRFALYESGGVKGGRDYSFVDPGDRQFLDMVTKNDREKAIQIIRDNIK